MFGEHAISHLNEDILADKFQVAADIPKLLSDLEIFLLAFLRDGIKFDSFAAVVVNYIFIVGQSCLCLLVAPSS